MSNTSASTQEIAKYERSLLESDQDLRELAATGRSGMLPQSHPKGHITVQLLHVKIPDGGGHVPYVFGLPTTSSKSQKQMNTARLFQRVGLL